MSSHATNMADLSTAEVLKARAKALANPISLSREGDDALELIEFRLAHERYALEQQHVQEVYPLEALTPLPCVPEHVMGIVNLRGQILPVMNLKKFFGLPEAGITDLHMIIVIWSEEVEVGILADSVAGVCTVSTAALQPSLPTLTGIREQYLKGIAPGQMVVLDAMRILEDPKLIVDEEVQA